MKVGGGVREGSLCALKRGRVFVWHTVQLADGHHRTPLNIFNTEL